MAVDELTRSPVRSKVALPEKKLWQRIPTGLLFVLPFFVLYVAFLVVPLFLGLGMSFYDWSLSGAPPSFVGFANYAELFTDPAVWSSLWNTVVFTLMTTPGLVLISLVMALLTNRAMPGRWLFRLAYFAPFLVPVTVVTTVWKWIFGTDFGFLNGLLEWVGMAPVDWLGQPGSAMLAVTITTTWWTIGFNYLLYLAGLQGIPPEVYEASSIDGASGWQQLTRITLPLLGRTTGLVLILQLIASLKVFDQIYLLTQGGPNFSTRPILEYVYDVGFTGMRLGYSSAISYVFFVIICVFVIFQFKFFSKKEDR